MSKIEFNGKTYNDVAEMPATERQAYEQLMAAFKDENQDGIPDIFQGDVVSNIIKAASTSVLVDGKHVSGLSQMTQEQRINLEKGMSMLKKLGVISEMPDFESRLHPSHPEARPVWDETELRPSKPLSQQKSAIQMGGGSSRLVLIAIALVSLLVCGAGALFFFLSG